MSENEEALPILKRSIEDNAWLNLGDVRKLEINNPLIDKDSEHPGLAEMRLMRDSNYLGYAVEVLMGLEALPEQCVVLEEMWKRPFPMYIASRGFGKSFLLAVYAMLKCALVPGTKIVIVGAAFRQSKVIFEYMVNLWDNAPILRSICDNNSGPRSSPDRCLMKINDSWAMAVPLGDGSKIRGLRAHTIMADEFASIPPDIFETVVRGFTAVSAKPVDNVKDAARRANLMSRGLWTANKEGNYSNRRVNQVIISGTADYDFKHYADYWRKYCKIIRSKGEPKRLKEIFGDDEIPKNFDYTDFSVIRIPYKMIPEGFMDDKQVAQAKATVHSGIYQMEYGACFTTDSDGFFKRSLIESCVTNKEIQVAQAQIQFDALIRGNPGYEYVYGVDPASENDNFSIVILEMREDHNRIVYSWTTTRKDFVQRKKAGITADADFYGFCARKIRDLMKVFPTQNIALDAQGGGIAVMEALHDPAKLMPGERLLWPVIDPDKEQLTDHEAGDHYLHMIQFANYDWVYKANHGLRKDFEDRVLLFPRFDGMSLALAIEYDGNMADVEESVKKRAKGDKRQVFEPSMYDSLEDSLMELEELKDELCTITMTRTGNGVGARDRWDTPELVMPNGRKGRLRKDRYSSLVMANMVARSIQRELSPVRFGVVGGFSHDLAKERSGSQSIYAGAPAWLQEGAGTGNWMRKINKKRT